MAKPTASPRLRARAICSPTSRSTDKRLEIYPGLFHEIYNEPERDAVLDDLIGWFDAHVKANRAA